MPQPQSSPSLFLRVEEGQNIVLTKSQTLNHINNVMDHNNDAKLAHKSPQARKPKRPKQRAKEPIVSSKSTKRKAIDHDDMDESPTKRWRGRAPESSKPKLAITVQTLETGTSLGVPSVSLGSSIPEEGPLSFSRTQSPQSSLNGDEANLEVPFLSTLELKEILCIAAYVGRKQNSRTKRWERMTGKPALSSRDGKRIAGRFKRLHNYYSDLINAPNRNSNSSTTTGVEDIEHWIEAIINAIETECTIIRQQFPAHIDRENKQACTFLVDMYFHLVPSMLECFRTAFKARLVVGFLETRALEEINRLLKAIRQLIGIAISQPKRYQPTATGYQTIQPIKKIWAILQKKSILFQEELDRRERSLLRRRSKPWPQVCREEPEEDFRARADQIHRYRHPEQQEPEEERLARLERNRRLCRQYEEDEEEWFNDPLFSAAARRKVLAAKWELKQSRELPRRLVSEPVLQNNSAPSYSQAPSERLQLFQIPNRSEYKPRNWQEHEILALTNAMKLHRDEPDVFESLADRLDRTLDDVFAMARELQQCLDDHRREKGYEYLNTLEFAWTRRIWFD